MQEVLMELNTTSIEERSVVVENKETSDQVTRHFHQGKTIQFSTN